LEKIYDFRLYFYYNCDYLLYFKKNKKDEERRIDYEQSDYFNQTKNTYYDIKTDAGKRGRILLVGDN